MIPHKKPSDLVGPVTVNSPESVLSVFLSSTYRDLIAYRKATYDALRPLDYHVRGMENFGASYLETLALCRQELGKSDLFVGILGFCYGSSPRGNEISFTELEYDAAAAASLPSLMFLAAAELKLPFAELREPDEKWARQQTFRAKVISSGHPFETFRSPEELARKVLQAVHRYFPRGAVGAIRKPKLENRLVHSHPLQFHFTGRRAELRELTDWWLNGKAPLMVVSGMGGSGKSELVWAWANAKLIGHNTPGLDTDVAAVPTNRRPAGVFWWSFYQSGAGFNEFLDEAVSYVSRGEIDPAGLTSDQKARKLVEHLSTNRLLLVLDGFERQTATYSDDRSGDFRACTEPVAAEFLRAVASVETPGRVLLTTRLFPRELDNVAGVERLFLRGLQPKEACAFLRACGVRGNNDELRAAAARWSCLPLALRLIAGVATRDHRVSGNIHAAGLANISLELKAKEHHILEVAYQALDSQQRELLASLCNNSRPLGRKALVSLCVALSGRLRDRALDDLADRGLLLFDSTNSTYQVHPVVREYVRHCSAGRGEPSHDLRDFLTTAARPEEAHIENTADLEPAIEMYLHELSIKRYDEACEVFRKFLQDPLYYWIADYHLQKELLRSLFRHGVERPPKGLSETNQAWALNALASCYSRNGDSVTALSLQQHQIVIRERQRDTRNLIVGIVNMAADQLRLGRLADAESNLRRSVELAGQLNDGMHQAITHRELGLALAYLGELEESRRELEAALVTLGGGQDLQSRGLVYASLTLRALLAGEPQAALEAATACSSAAQDCGTERDKIRSEWLLGAAKTAAAAVAPAGAMRTGMLVEAEVHLKTALKRARRIALLDVQPDIALARARLSLQNGDLRDAAAFAGAALRLATRCRYRLIEADAEQFLAELALYVPDRQSALKHAEAACRLALCDNPMRPCAPVLQKATAMVKRLTGVTSWPVDPCHTSSALEPTQIGKICNPVR